MILIVAAAGFGCSFDTSGIAGPGGGPTTPGADACVPGCESDTTQRICEPMPTTRACPLGCDTEAQACNTLVPSNGVTVAEHLADVTSELSIDAGAVAVIESDTGKILVNEQIVRGEGLGESGGIRFAVLPDSAQGVKGAGVLGVDGLMMGTNAVVRVRGSRPLIVLSRGAVRIEGVIDISAGCDASSSPICGGPGGGSGSTVGANKPAGTPGDLATGCAPGGNGTGSGAFLNSTDETGGGGGGFGTAGAAGGTGNEPGGLGGTDRTTCPGPELVPLMGGSGGGAGGVGNNGGDSGGGGGALQITSLVQISVIGQSGSTNPPGIHAGGAGGGGGQSNDGGGGGGSGGGILLEAPAIFLQHAALAANGGAGGGGGGGGRGGDGTLGSAQAQGGTGRYRGGAGASLMGDAAPGEGGGDNTGGGGGGAGIIRLNVPEAGLDLGSSTISPNYTRGELVLAPTP